MPATSAKTTLFVASLEGLRLTAYDMEGDIAGVDTIGYGHLLTKRERETGRISMDGMQIPWQHGITRDQAASLLTKDLSKFIRHVRTSVEVRLTDYQLTALVAFCYNVGIGAFSRSTLLVKLNSGDYTAVPAELGRWIYNNGEVLNGLKNRRTREAMMWRGEIQ